MSNSIQNKIKNFFTKFPLQRYSKGEIVLHPEDNPSGAYYLASGHVREYAISPQGIEVTIHIFNPHSFFPMTWILSDIPNRYYYEAFTDVELYSAPKDKIMSFLKQEPDVVFDLTQRIFSGVDKLTARIEHLAFGKAYTRVVSVLIYLARHFGEKKDDNSVVFKYKLTHREIASLAGISRETASREWEKLQEQSLISYVDQMISIKDLKKLEALFTE